MKPTAFATIAAWRSWLQKNHATKRELLVKLFKVHALHRGIGYREALDEALCWGWIDGIKKRLDDDSFTHRFSPRTARSYWSKVNIKRFKELEAEGRVFPPGRAAFKPESSAKARYTFETAVNLDPKFLKRIRANPTAWKNYQASAPGYQRIFSRHVMLAARDETREKRFGWMMDRLMKGKLTR